MTVRIEKVGPPIGGYTWISFRSMPETREDRTEWALYFDPDGGGWEAIKFRNDSFSKGDPCPERLDDFLAFLTDKQKADAVAAAMRARR